VIDSAGASDASPPKWFVEYQQKVDGRLSEIGKDFGRIRDKLPKEEPKSETPAQPDQRAEMLAAMSLGEIRSKLPPKALAKLNAKIEANESFVNVKAWADDLIENLSEQQSVARDARPQTPTGVAASAAPSTSEESWTQSKLVELARKDKVRYNKVMDEFAAKSISVFTLPMV
jgi:hypothetical protein